VVEVPLDRGVDVQVRNQLGDTPFMVAALQGYSEVGGATVSSGMQQSSVLNSRNLGETPLTLAASQGHTETVKVAKSWC